MERVLEQLGFLANQLDKETHKACLDRVDSIRERMRADQMHLALVGDFSSGKTTFVNALLKERLLTVSDLPTTAIPTYIDWSASWRTRVSVRDTKGARRSMGLLNRQWLKKQTGTEIPKDRNGLIEYLTTTNGLETLISDVRISLPGENGHPGFCIIDTPGVNPGGRESQNHVLQTQAVLQEEADAAIVLFPCYNVYTSSFRDFLEENAGHLVGNSVFVITKMDQVPTEQERTKLIRFVAAQLQYDFGMEAPEVYGCSSDGALRSYTSSPADPEYGNWAAEFEGMTESIFQSFAQRRREIIDRKLWSMIRLLRSDMETLFSAREAELRKSIAILKLGTAECVEQQFQTLLEVYEHRMEEAEKGYCKEITGEIREVIRNTEDKLDEKIMSKLTRFGLRLSLGGIVTNGSAELRSRSGQVLYEKMKAVREGYLQEYRAFVGALEELLTERGLNFGKMDDLMKRMDKFQFAPAAMPREIQLVRPAVVDSASSVCLALAAQFRMIEGPLADHCRQRLSGGSEAFVKNAQTLLADYRTMFRGHYDRTTAQTQAKLTKTRESMEQNQQWLEMLRQMQVPGACDEHGGGDRCV